MLEPESKEANMAKKKELSSQERKDIEKLIRRRQKVHDQLEDLQAVRGRKVVAKDSYGHRNENSLEHIVAGDLADYCRALSLPVPAKVTKILKDRTQHEKDVAAKRAVLEAEQVSVQKEIDIIYGVHSGQCPLCGHAAPCPTSY